ncbi:1664_t:CDS:2 [Diversispora eburnea]|uniref:1664_t:CDS:1 n=1 Tax=Diversispora eburnea TaxID=1213867 RepID=A0A9N8WAU6_9GLOM|nr:1664_t:CDS:2 [Diversispora eburnea]
MAIIPLQQKYERRADTTTKPTKTNSASTPKLTSSKELPSSTELSSSIGPTPTELPSTESSKNESENDSPSVAITGIFIIIVIMIIIAFIVRKKVKNKRRRDREGSVRLIDEPGPSGMLAIQTSDAHGTLNNFNYNDERVRVPSKPPMVQLNRSSAFALDYDPRNSSQSNRNLNNSRDVITPIAPINTNLNITQKPSPKSTEPKKKYLTPRTSVHSTSSTNTTSTTSDINKSRPSSTLVHDLEMEETQGGISPMNRITLSDYNDYNNVVSEPYPTFESQFPSPPHRLSSNLSVCQSEQSEVSSIESDKDPFKDIVVEVKESGEASLR